MLLPTLWLLASTATVLAKTLPDIPLIKPDEWPGHAATEGGFIVQLKKDTSLGLKKRSHEQFHKRASLGLDYKVRTEFTNENLFYGVSIQLTENKTTTDVQAILDAIPEVEASWPIQMIARPGNFSISVSETSSSAAVAAGFGPTDDSPVLPAIKGANVLSTLKMGGVDKLHAKGIKGKGIKIGIVDTGVDYLHPSLGGGFGPGFKIAGGYSFMNDQWYGVGTPKESPDPYSNCSPNGHGSHTTGIIGALDPEGTGFGLSGVAPEAELYMYKVFSCLSEGTPNDVIMKAMVRAAEDGVDVISMSLGYITYFQAASPFTSLIQSIISQGIGLVVANGNDGELGLYGESTPADGPGVIAVGSITNDVFPITYTAEDSDGESFQYGSVWPLDAPEMNVYFHGSSCLNVDWLATTNAVSDASNTIIIAQESNSCALGDLMSRAYSYGLPYLLAYSIKTSPFDQDIETQIPFDVATIVVPPSTGAKLVSKLQANPSYKLKFTSSTAASIDLATGGMMSNFSSFGPSWDTLSVKPTLSAPGGKILSTWPLGASAGYAIISGTSMATPFVAGAYALVKSQYPDLSPLEIGNMLQSTATPVSYVYDKSVLASVAHQGAGLINVFNAITYGTLVSPSEINIGDLDDFTRTPHTITINNKAGAEKKIFLITHEGAGYAEYFPYPDLLEPNDQFMLGQPQYPIYATARFSQPRITVHAGETLEFRAYITQPKLTDAQLAKNPLISGFFKLTSATETHTIPYLGVPYSRQDYSGFDTSVYHWEDYDGQTYSAKQPFIYCGTCDHRAPNTGIAEYNGTEWDFATVWYNFKTGVSHSIVSVVQANTTFKPTHHGGNPPKGYKYQDPGITPHETYQGLPSYGWIVDNIYYNSYAPHRDTTNHYPFQSWATFIWGSAYFEDIREDGETFQYLPNGDYRLLVSLAKTGTDVDDWSQWETYLSPVIRLVGKNF